MKTDLDVQERELLGAWKTLSAGGAAKSKALALGATATGVAVVAEAAMAAKAAPLSSAMAKVGAAAKVGVAANAGASAPITGLVVAKWVVTGALMGGALVGVGGGASVIHDRVVERDRLAVKVVATSPRANAGPAAQPKAEASLPAPPPVDSEASVQATPPVVEEANAVEEATVRMPDAATSPASPKVGGERPRAPDAPPAPRPSTQPPTSAPPASPERARSIGSDLATIEASRGLVAAGRAEEALGRLSTVDAHSPLAIEAAALEVDALERAGHHARAIAAARTFIARYPTSPYAVRVRRLLDEENSVRP